jgi:hypothetical protein
MADKDIEDLKGRIENLENQIKNLDKSVDNFNGKIGDSKNLLRDMGNAVINNTKANINFTKSFQKQYQIAEKLAESYKKTAINIGVSHRNQKEFGKTFAESASLVTALGGEIGDVERIYTRFVDQSGRARILSPEEVQNIFAVEKATGLAGEAAVELAERFDLMGLGSKVFTENISEMVADSQKMGLNSSKVTKKLQENFKSMQNMSFRGGVKAMTEMAKLSVKMRMEIGEMLNMADKFYEPEAAIEAAANLQMLGGDVAAAFGDPIQMMYEARNAPEELAKRVGQVTENMMQFNESTGEFEMPPEARMQLNAMADSLGLSKDQIMDTARQMSKMKEIKMDLKGSMFDEKQQEYLASLATFDPEDKQWKVDVRDPATGDMVKKSFDELTDSDLKMVMEQPKDEKDAMMITAQEAMTTNQHLAKLRESFELAFVKDFNIYQQIEGPMKETAKEMAESNKKFAEEATKTLEKTDFGKRLGSAVDKVGDVVDKMAGVYENAVSSMSDVVKESFSNIDFSKTIEEMNIQSLTANEIKLNKKELSEIKTEEKVEDTLIRPGMPPIKFDENDIIAATTNDIQPVTQEQLNQPLEMPKINIPNIKSPIDGGKISVDDVNVNMNFGTLTVQNSDGSAVSQVELDNFISKAEFERLFAEKFYAEMKTKWDGGKSGGKTGADSIPTL